jgi:hypothetical protein
MKQPKKSNLPTRGIKAKASKTRKLSMAEMNWVMDALATGLSPREVRERLWKETGTDVTRNAIAAYLKTHAHEIALRRKAWNENVLDKVQLRFSGARVLELANAYRLLYRQFFREVCKECIGEGKTLKPGSVTTPFQMLTIADYQRCEICRGRRWIIPKRLEIYSLGDDVLMGAVRIAALSQPPGFDPVIWDKMAAILRQIREEVGDAKPEKSSSSEELEAIARAAAYQSFKERVDNMTTEEFIAAMQARGQRTLVNEKRQNDLS